MPTIHRFYMPPGQSPALTDREAHHALGVLRLKSGDTVIVQDGAGHEYECAIGSHNRKRVELIMVKKQFTPTPPCPITLLVAIPKGKIETIVEKATELGVTRIVPLLTDRTVVHIDATNAPGKVEKWRQIAIEAIKQCGSPWLPKIELPQTPAQFLARGESFELPLIASLQSGSRHLRDIFRNYQTERGRPPKSACVWVGPEGDFTPAEIAAVQAVGAFPITLGPLVLRADTATIYCLSILNHELQT